MNLVSWARASGSKDPCFEENGIGAIRFRDSKYGSKIQIMSENHISVRLSGILHDKSKVVYPATRGIDLVFWKGTSDS